MDTLDEVLAELDAATPDAPVSLGRYDVVGRIGRGGMGAVYDAVDRERGTRVALKTLTAGDAAAGVSLKREFRVVADLTHENLAPVYELASDRGIGFFTMQHVDGVSLTEWARGRTHDDQADATDVPLSRTHASPDQASSTLKSPGVAPPPAIDELLTRRSDPAGAMDLDLPLPPGTRASAPSRDMDEIRRAFAELVCGVAALHDAGLRHGDIKPANVLVRADGRVLLVDYGLVRPVGAGREARTSSGGTPTFMAPEQFGDSEIGPEADWYAVGATMYCVLTGSLPFGATSLLDLYLKKTSQLPPPPHELVPTLPIALGETAMALMNPDPKRRPGRDDLLRVFGPGEANDTASISSDLARLPTRQARRGHFVGRDSELLLLEHAYGAARAGRATVVHTHGPSGIGKSALLTSFLGAVAEVDAAIVLRGRCYERESVPYKGFDRIVDDLSERMQRMPVDEVESLLPDWAGELGRSFPALAAVPAIAARAAGKHVAHDALELRRRSWVALRELLVALRRRSPLVLAIDDLQWADEDSAGLLAALLSAEAESSRPALLVVVLYRPQEAAANRALDAYFEIAAKLTAEGRLVDVPLLGLVGAEAEDLARAALRDAGAPESERRARFLAKEAGGVPFFIEELAHYLRNHPPEEDGYVSVETAIRARVDALPHDQRALVELVAVAANPVPQTILFEAAGLDQGALAALLSLRSASLVSSVGASAGDAVSAYHDRIRECVVAMLDVATRLERHLALGRALARRHRDARGWIFDAVRHLGAAATLIGEPAERLEVARLHAEAGERARDAAAFSPAPSSASKAASRFYPPMRGKPNTTSRFGSTRARRAPRT